MKKVFVILVMVSIGFVSYGKGCPEPAGEGSGKHIVSSQIKKVCPKFLNKFENLCLLNVKK